MNERIPNHSVFRDVRKFTDASGCVRLAGKEKRLMGKRVLVVGGVAGGASVAARVRRLDADASVIVFERGEHVSFSNCSLPYYLSRTVEEKDSLVLMTPESFKASYDIDVRANSEVLSIDRAGKKVLVRSVQQAENMKSLTTIWCCRRGQAPSARNPSRAWIFRTCLLFAM